MINDLGMQEQDEICLRLSSVQVHAKFILTFQALTISLRNNESIIIFNASEYISQTMLSRVEIR